MTKRSKVEWQPAAAPNSSACPPLPAAVFGVVVNGGSPKATAVSARNAARATTAVATFRLDLCLPRMICQV